MSDIKKEYALLRLAEIKEIENAPRPPASLDCRYYDWGDGNGSYWSRLEAEKEDLLRILGEDKPYEYMTSEEKFEKFGKSSIMLAQENAAKSILDE